MKILALETSSAEGGIALLENNEILAELPFKTNENFGQNLFPHIEALLKQTRLTLKELDLICVNIGPGSYTGIRVGVTSANTLSWANQIPLIGVSCLYAMAYEHKTANPIRSIIYSSDKDAFTALYSYNDQKLETLEPDQRVSWAYLEQTNSTAQQVVYFSAKKLAPAFAINSYKEWVPSAKSVAFSSLSLYSKTSEKAYGTCLPNYLKEFEVTPKQK